MAITISVRVYTLNLSNGAELGTFTDLTEKFATSKDGQNYLVDIIVSGFTLEGMSSPEAAVTTVADTMSGVQYLDVKNLAWQDLLDYYSALN